MQPCSAQGKENNNAGRKTFRKDEPNFRWNDYKTEHKTTPPVKSHWRGFGLQPMKACYDTIT